MAVKGLDALELLEDRLCKIGDEFPERQRELHERLGRILELDLQRNIVGTIGDTHGKIRGFQRRYVGSHGGYTAVRPAKEPSGKNGAAAVTSALESGHRIRRASGLNKRYRPRIHTPYVSGRHFYLRTQASSAGLLQRECERFAEELAMEMNKNL